MLYNSTLIVTRFFAHGEQRVLFLERNISPNDTQTHTHLAQDADAAAVDATLTVSADTCIGRIADLVGRFLGHCKCGYRSHKLSITNRQMQKHQQQQLYNNVDCRLNLLNAKFITTEPHLKSQENNMAFFDVVISVLSPSQ